MFSREFTLAEHSRRFTVSASDSGGWELQVTQDRAVVLHRSYSDWHRLERAMSAIEREMSELLANGWRVTEGPSDPTYSTKR